MTWYYAHSVTHTTPELVTKTVYRKGWEVNFLTTAVILEVTKMFPGGDLPIQLEVNFYNNALYEAEDRYHKMYPECKDIQKHLVHRPHVFTNPWHFDWPSTGDVMKIYVGDVYLLELEEGR